MRSECANMRTFYTAKGLRRYDVEVRHSGLNKYQLIRGDDRYVVQQKAQAKMDEWDDMWERRQEAEQKRLERQQRAIKIQEQKDLAAERTQEAKAALHVLDTILAHTLEVDDTVDWDALKVKSDYPEPKPGKPAHPPRPEPPEKPSRPSVSQFPPRLGILGRLIPSSRAAREGEAQALYTLALRRWKEDRSKAVATYNAQAREFNDTVRRVAEQHKRSVAEWQTKRDQYLRRREETNAAIDRKKQKYMQGDADAIIDYCDMVLSNSEYPDWFPQSYEVDYNPENKVLIVEYELPSLDSVPTLREVTYVQSKHEFAEKYVSDAELRRKYDAVLYQIALRTIHELYEADTVDGLASIVFNGHVDSVDKATGQQIRPCVLSVQANKEEFGEISLAAVDPKACFKKLKGVGSSRLHSMTPVAPVLTIDREDYRFVEGRAVVDGLDEADNLAAMDWEDFEHLIRELFEKEFAQGGGEVRVTRASRDGGVDAVIFDPDPLRGGKIVVQAKRYTNTIGVAAVRDLYGTVVNEGANKGILVSTSDYGPDSYEFAKGKPLVLLSGAQLLHLLEKHGHKARIDIAEAKRLLSERDTT